VWGGVGEVHLQWTILLMACPSCCALLLLMHFVSYICLVLV
jgi:hypothetical protein